MAQVTFQLRLRDRLALLALVVGCGFALRLVAAYVLQAYVDRHFPARLCLFPDTAIYWQLGHAIRAGEPFRVLLWGVPHWALRTPGYPVFLAACQVLFGDRVLPVRLVQAGLGASCAWLVER